MLQSGLCKLGAVSCTRFEHTAPLRAPEIHTLKAARFHGELAAWPLKTSGMSWNLKKLLTMTMAHFAVLTSWIGRTTRFLLASWKEYLYNRNTKRKYFDFRVLLDGGSESLRGLDDQVVRFQGDDSAPRGCKNKV